MKNKLKQLKSMLPVLLIMTALSSPAQEIILTTTNANIISSRTSIDLPGLSGNSNAIIIATPLGNTSTANPHPIGAWYYAGKWNIFNSDHAPLVSGLIYKVQYFVKPDPNQFLHLVTKQNIGKEGSYIDNSALNSNPNAQFSIFQNHSPEVRQGPSLNGFEAKAGYSTDARKWYITNIGGERLFPGTAYNVVVSSGDIIGGNTVKYNPEIIAKEPQEQMAKEPQKQTDKSNPDIFIREPGKVSETTPVVKAIDMKDFVPKKASAPAYDFSNVHMCIDYERNTSLPPKPPVTQYPVIPKIKPNGQLEPVTTVTQPLSIATNSMWSTGETITVGFLPGASLALTNKIKNYVKGWENYGNIRFVFINDVSQAKIKVGFIKDNTSWSWLGRDVLVNPSNLQTMNFGWLYDHTKESEVSRVVIHEFGHALGFVHEHQSPASGIPWDKEKVYAYFEQFKWSHETVDLHVFAKYSLTSTNSTAYDKLSIMHYYFPPELTTDSSDFTVNTNLSVIDKEFVSQVYPFPPTSPTAAGVLLTGDDCDEIEFKVEYNVVNSDVIRFILEPGIAPNGNIITWWKKIAIPLLGNAEAGMVIQDGHSATKSVPVVTIDKDKGISFGKAKFLGVHTGLVFTWKVWPAIVGGCRVTLVWRRDSCL